MLESRDLNPKEVLKMIPNSILIVHLMLYILGNQISYSNEIIQNNGQLIITLLKDISKL